MTFVGIDINVLAYPAGVSRAAGDTAKINAARTLPASLKADVTVTVSTQAWGELFAVLTRTGMGHFVYLAEKWVHFISKAKDSRPKRPNDG